ncbi:MAG: SRPBCC family protein [Actinomycetota bacterium]
MTVEFECEERIAAPVETVFDLSLDIDVHVASMADSGERAIGGVTSGLIGLGENVTWRAKHFGVPFTMTSRITEFDRPARFVDEQQRGPFRRFRHEHLFEPVDGSTLMTDRISFDAPLWVLGDVVELAVLGRYLEKLIRERNKFLKAEAERRAAT